MQSSMQVPLRYCFLLTTLSIPLATGCGGSAPATSSNNQGSASQTDSLGQSTTTNSSAQSDPFAAAKQSVAVFLDCLRRGDEATANSMLTSKAREELLKTAWVMQPLGTPEGRYTIGRAGYPYADQKVVLVESRWQEPSIPNQPEMAMEIVCELYQEAAGWRIAGIAVTMVGEEESLVIDFEDGAGLQQMLDLANGISPPANSTQTGATGAQATQVNISLPQLPEFPASNGSQQIAQPPNSGAILR